MSRADFFTICHENERRRMLYADATRWGLSFIVVLIVTSGGLWWIARPPQLVSYVAQSPAISIDLSPEPVTMSNPPTDTAIGPQQTLSQPIPQLAPPQKITVPESPVPNPPVPVSMPKKVYHLVKKNLKAVPTPKKSLPDKLPAALKTTEPPSSDATPTLNSAAPAPGALSSHASYDPVTWQGALLARLEKFKRYPSEAQGNHQEGVAMLTFTIDRQGHVLSARLTGRSGYDLLDQETLALIQRADPLPVPPDSVLGNTIELTVPIEFSIKDLKN